MEMRQQDGIPETVESGTTRSGEQYAVVGYWADDVEEYLWYDVFIDNECINLGECFDIDTVKGWVTDNAIAKSG